MLKETKYGRLKTLHTATPTSAAWTEDTRPDGPLGFKLLGPNSEQSPTASAGRVLPPSSVDADFIHRFSANVTGAGLQKWKWKTKRDERGVGLWQIGSRKRDLRAEKPIRRASFRPGVFNLF